ncbi:MAG: CHC2 zinc finger domain-containing protein [Gammaproteobacteria bacterium]|jgi:DNA primase catalytic core
MARIPDAELARLKQDIALERLAESRGIRLKRHGADLIGLCPFHNDKEPSLVISPDKNLWHCLGACQTGGTVIDWVMKTEGVSFRHAVELLRTDPSLAASSAMPVKKSTVTKLPTPLDASAEDQTLLKQVVDYYHETLKHSPEALAYLDKRGLNDPALVDHFKLGFANRTLGYRLPEKNRKEGAAIRGRLQRLGLIRSSGHEHFRGSLVIPVINDGQVLELYGRKVRDDLRKGTPTHLYLPGPHQGVFNLEAFADAKEIILCESLIDALTFWSAGYRNVTCSYGVEGFTKHHLQAFSDHSIERVLIAYGRDAAGEAAAEQLSKTLLKAGIDCYRIHFPKGMDANEYALQVQPASKSLGVTIRSAIWLGKGRAPGKPTTSAESATITAAAKLKTIAGTAASTPSLAAERGDETDTAKTDTPLPAAVIPAAPQADVAADINDEDIVISLGDRRYRIRGLSQNLSVNQLKINILANRGDALHVDTFDLYAAKARAGFVRQAAIELAVKEDVIKRDLGKVLLKGEALQEAHIKKALQPKQPSVSVNEAEKADALTLLNDPNLLQHILDDFTRCGVVGEETNKLVGYLAATSRKLDKPLAVMVQSSSAAGKSSLMEAVLALMPDEDKVQYSAMTGQSLFYMEDGNLQHKILAIAEEEGAERAAYALKLLQSEGELSIASTGKDPQSGRLVTHEYQVEGPVMIFSTTTSIEPDEELLNRCIVLGVDEGREQTQAIHRLQRQSRTLAGLIAKQEKTHIVNCHHNAQRLLKPLAVINPYSEHLTFLDDRTRLRRDHEKYLTLIDSIALLHQYQRPLKHVQVGDESIAYIEVTLDDIAQANRLAHAMLGRSLDVLPPQTRRLLMLIETRVADQAAAQDMARTDYRFSRREVPEHTGWGNTQLRVHLDRLVDMEYLLVHRGGRGQSFVYELLYDGQGKDGQAFLMGLIDVEQLKTATTTGSTRGEPPTLAGSSRGQNGRDAGLSQTPKSSANPENKGAADDEPEILVNHGYTGTTSGPSYRSHSPVLIAKEG